MTAERTWLWELHRGRFTSPPRWVTALIKAHREETGASLFEACRHIASVLRDHPGMGSGRAADVVAFGMDRTSWLAELARGGVSMHVPSWVRDLIDEWRDNHPEDRSLVSACRHVAQLVRDLG